MSRGRTIVMTVIGTIFVALGVVIWVVDPSSRGVAATAILFFGACLAVGLLELFGQRASRVTRARLMGAIAMVMGLGCGALGFIAWQDPHAFDRAPWQVSVAVGVAGLLFFGLGGLLLFIRGGRPLGLDRDGFRR